MMNDKIEAPFGVVDMGSNGIRFGIVSALARHLPVAYEERAPIALLEAQGDERIIPSDVIDQVITSFLRFKLLCQDAGVHHVRVIATEATRIAVNAQEFLDRIHQATGWQVSLLSKQEEALISASGIVGSFHQVNGLTMDLGGGSVEVSYVMMDPQAMRVSPHPVSMPFGAAALKRKLAQCESEEQVRALYEQVVAELQKAHDQAQLPESLCHPDGYDVYMSGGGFRALGYLSMAVNAQDTLLPRQSTNRKHMYPIPIINGYSISGKKLKALAKFYRHKQPEELIKKLKVFRISKRRAGMIPASCFLVSAILKVYKIRRIYFSEGGVRQGFCYQLLSTAEKQKDPFLEGVKAYAAQSPFSLSETEYEAIDAILVNALPPIYLDPKHPLQLHRLLPAAIHLSNLTSHYPKETRAFVAFHMPLAGGPLANVPGLSHRERAILSILLTFRQGGSVPDPIFYAIQSLVGRRGVSVCKYIGRLMELVFAVSPLRPGMSLHSTGLSFTTILPDQHQLNHKEEPSSSGSGSSSSELEDEDEEQEQTVEEEKEIDYYPSMQLRIRLPQHHSPLIDAPAIMSVIESIDKKVNTKKFDMDAEHRPLKCPNLFSVEVMRQ
ncbi:Ppx/GppA phosphatase family-domain-containing protein [Gilbertella persicaria]|uniref:Ppx/GppA phosphatase family-domain-containing protein n=1 Tax=Gilbertella persicaria TaxID=101096 RepID=UPI00221F96C3|nr:Ppx/GppA phosphatase family-domain-containing protein [Gilbertella persicaria]KAI8083960.1 Ppx/GppA phosphatase family-domain-containing protein [Gilbertella persicaria]